MKGLKTLRLSLAGIAVGALLLAGGLLLASQASAITGSLSMGSATAAPGAQTSVDLSANVGGAPGLGAWTVDISYGSAVSVVSCAPNASAGANVCNAHFPDRPNTIRITGANPNGLTGNTTLGSVTFMCGSSAGTSPLTLSVEVFSDATIGGPLPITHTETNGSISCAVPATAGPAATATPIIRVPTVGTGGPSNGSDFSWLIASLAAAGVIALAGYGALRVRTRNS